jgi:hypothetical protein
MVLLRVVVRIRFRWQFCKPYLGGGTILYGVRRLGMWNCT